MVFVLLCTFTLAAQPSFASINWNPGDPGTTLQEWLFNTPDNPAAPETDENQYGDPVANIKNNLPNNPFGWANGVWSGSAFSVTIDIPNNPVPNLWKEVQVEVIYKGTLILAWVRNGDGAEFSNVDWSFTDLGNGWTKLTDLWRIEPNPDWERVCYGFEALTGALAAVDSIRISTICIPEPATMLLLSLGVLVLRKKK
jgi:hypothetical protein